MPWPQITRLSGAAMALTLACLCSSPRAASAQAPKSSPEDPDYWRQFEVGLDWDPVGYTIKKNQLAFVGLIPMQPVGLPADYYNHYLSPMYGLGDGWEVSLNLTGAEALGPGGEALFYGGGIQKQLMRESGWKPAVSVGGTGYLGPHDHHGGSVYAVASRRVWHATNGSSRALFLHAGLKAEIWDAPDLDSSAGLRPFFGANVALTRRVFLSADISPRQAWQRSTPYSLSATVLVHKTAGISGGIHNDGYRTLPYVGVSF